MHHGIVDPATEKELGVTRVWNLLSNNGTTFECFFVVRLIGAGD